MSSRVVLDEKGIKELLTSPRGPVAAHLVRRAVRVENAAKRSFGGSGRPHVPSAPGSPPNVDTGRLRSSITHDLSVDAQGIVARVGTDVEYGLYLEVGTSKMEARPYLRPALAAELGAPELPGTGTVGSDLGS